MKVIFLESVKSKGNKGDVKDVSEGYARNYLLPKKLAVEANKGNMKQLEAKIKGEEKREENEHELANKLKQTIENLNIELKAKSGEDGRLFGSVTSKQIAQALKQKNIKVDKRKIELSDPIRTLGYTNVPIKLPQKVTAVLKIHVTEE